MNTVSPSSEATNHIEQKISASFQKKLDAGLVPLDGKWLHKDQAIKLAEMRIKRVDPRFAGFVITSAIMIGVSLLLLILVSWLSY